MKILFDTNLWISFMIGKRLSSLADVLCRHDVEVYICEQELDEIRRVLARLFALLTRNCLEFTNLCLPLRPNSD